jgi:hypothetical protein
MRQNKRGTRSYVQVRPSTAAIDYRMESSVGPSPRPDHECSVETAAESSIRLSGEDLVRERDGGTAAK